MKTTIPYLEVEIRTALICMLVEVLGFPRAWIAVEKQLKELSTCSSCPPPNRRVDLLAYGFVHKKWSPLLLIECKRETIEHAVSQVIGYNAFVCAPFVAVASREKMQWGYCKSGSGSYVWRSGIPSYCALLKMFVKKR